MQQYYFVWIVGCPYNLSAEEVGGIEVFLNEADQNLDHFSNIQDQNVKKSETCIG